MIYYILYSKEPPLNLATRAELLKVSRSRSKIVEPQILPKNEGTNLFFYPDNVIVSFCFILFLSVSYYFELFLDQFFDQLFDEFFDDFSDRFFDELF